MWFKDSKNMSCGKCGHGKLDARDISNSDPFGYNYDSSKDIQKSNVFGYNYRKKS